jgi:hypothetical protein
VISRNGEALGGGLRVGVPLGDRWDVDLEVARTGAIESSFAPVLENFSFVFMPAEPRVPDIGGFLPRVRQRSGGSSSAERRRHPSRHDERPLEKQRNATADPLDSCTNDLIADGRKRKEPRDCAG